MDNNLPARLGVLTALLTLLLTLLGASALLACQGLEDGSLVQEAPEPVDRPALQRRSGERLPAFSGSSPERRGWARVDDLLWIAQGDVDAYRQGLVHDGSRYVSVRSPLPPGTPAARGYRLRADHVALHTNAAWDRAKVVAREAEAHVQRLVSQYGEALDLRLPQGPLKLIVSASRRELETTLAGLVHHPVGWGAFYDARSGNVYMSLEAATRGALPWQADLRHEMTHQVLDLSRRAGRRGRTFSAPWFWLWEGIAIGSEGLGGRLGSQRAERFRKRYANGEWTRLADLVRLDAGAFEGRHYDQTASLMDYLLDPSRPNLRSATLSIVRDLLHGPVPADALERRGGLDLATLEARWQQTVGR
jgi:hypothetical protein